MFDWFKKKKTTPSYQEEKIILDFSNFSKVTDFIYRDTGITELDTRAFVSSQLKQYAQENSIYTTDQFLSELEKKDHFYQKIIDIATVNETYFFREKKELEWLIDYIEKSDKKSRILSLPSSSGEEIYTIILMLLARKISLDKVDIKGYDINSEMIKKAQDGLYNEHSLYSVNTDLKTKYFTKIDDKNFVIAESIKREIFFKQQNIFTIDTTREKYDIILSRNMFIYFDEKNRKKATQVIVDLLQNGGIFIKGHADFISQHKNLENLTFGVYKKIT